MTNLKILFKEEQIKRRVKELANEISKDYRSQKPILICVLNGSYIFFSDLTRALWNAKLEDFETDFVRILSYGGGKKSSGKPIMTKDLETNIEGKNVILVEDIIETGHTLKFLVDHLSESKPLSIKICSLLSKPLRKVAIEPNYLGFEVNGDDWVEGYGLDTAQLGRGRGDIIKRL